jgi:RNA polymerase sigma-70 factor (ECF subfamily)
LPFIVFFDMPDSGMTQKLNFVALRGEPTDSCQMVERARAGDREAFGELYKRYAPMVHGIILARVRRDEVDDILQEVFLSAHRNLGELRDLQAFGGWLAMIARRRTAQFYRSEEVAEILPEDLREREDRSAEAREILTAIRSLPDAYRETLVLRLVEGMTGPEIARQAGLTPESVRVNLHRGMKLLRAKLGLD